MASSLDACLVTPTYAPDFERCQLLVESRRACAPELDHYLIVDPADRPLFRQLADHKTTVVDGRELIDRNFHQVPGRSGWWLAWGTLPLRGWIRQQLYKLAMPRIVSHQALINVDSDVAFIRPFEIERLVESGRLGLCEVDFRNVEIEAWSGTAADLLGISPPSKPFNYVGNLIPWWSSEVEQLTDTIQRVSGVPWQMVLTRRRSFSEYMIYGTYIRHVRGFDDTHHFSDNRMHVRSAWHRATQTEDDLKQLFEDTPANCVAVMIHSKDHVNPESYRRFVRRSWHTDLS